MSDFVESDYMGILERRHYISDQPVRCVGAPLPERAITEITLYQAAYCETTKQVEKRKPLARLRMTESQFGQMLATPNTGNGELATLEFLDGHQILDTEDVLQHDPYKDELQYLVERSTAGDDQTRRFLQESIQQAEQCVASGKVGAKPAARVTWLLNLVMSNLPQNETYSITRVREAAAKRTDAVAASMHQYIRSCTSGLQQGIQGQPLMLVDSGLSLPEATAAAFFAVSSCTTSGIELFNDVNNSNRLVSFCLRSAVRHTDFEQCGYLAREELYRFFISPEQYGRWLRLEHGEIACTISRRGAESAGSVPAEHTSNISKQWEKQQRASTSDSSFIQSVQSLVTEVNAGSFGGKAGANRLLQDLQALSSMYQDHVTLNTPLMEQAVEDVIAEQQRVLTQYGQQQLSLLPAEMRQRIAAQLMPLLAALSKN